MINKTILGEILKQIQRENDIALYCHTNPDGDALGSMLALRLALTRKGKQVATYCDSTVPRKYTCLMGSECISMPDKRVHKLAISIDCSDLDRLGQCMKSYLSAKSQIAIDHHASHKKFADTTLVDAKAAACAEIVFQLIKQLRALDKDVAALLMAGLVTDSGCFAFSNTTRQTHAIACELMDLGIDTHDIIYRVYRSTDINRFRLKTRVLSKAKFDLDDAIAYIVFTKEDFAATDTSVADTEGIVSELIDIDSVQVAYALCEVNERAYKLSIRTKDAIDASEIARQFGGGGHLNAAGCRINGDPLEIIEKLTKLAKDRII